MKRYRLVYRGNRDCYYCFDTQTKKRESLGINNTDEAQRLVDARNEAVRHVGMNLQIAQVYLQHSDPTLATRRWQNVMDAMVPLKTGATQSRWTSAMRDKAFDSIKIEAVSLDSTTVKVHPEGTGALKKTGPQAIGCSRGGCTTKIHLVAAHARCALNFSLSPGQDGDAPRGRELLRAGGPAPAGCHLLMDRAYEGDETRALGVELGYTVVVPPNPNRLDPWEYDRVMYRRRNEVERLFRRLKGFRRVFSRFDKTRCHV